MSRNNSIQKILLTAGAIGWGIAVLGVLLPWNWIALMLQNMGATAPVTDPQLQYWFRMATGAWSIIGFLFLVVLLFPSKYRNLLPLLAIGTLFEGVVWKWKSAAGHSRRFADFQEQRLTAGVHCTSSCGPLQRTATTSRRRPRKSNRCV